MFLYELYKAKNVGNEYIRPGTVCTSSIHILVTFQWVFCIKSWSITYRINLRVALDPSRRKVNRKNIFCNMIMSWTWKNKRKNREKGTNLALKGLYWVYILYIYTMHILDRVCLEEDRCMFMMISIYYFRFPSFKTNFQRDGKNEKLLKDRQCT